jgi:hypothetical protein
MSTSRWRGLTAAETRGRVDVDEVVRHTDSGSGSSQAEHWTPTVSMPDFAIRAIF